MVRASEQEHPFAGEHMGEEELIEETDSMPPLRHPTAIAREIDFWGRIRLYPVVAQGCFGIQHLGLIVKESMWRPFLFVAPHGYEKMS